MNEETTTTALTITPEYRESYKYDKWLQYFTDRNNPKTYGNGVQSALLAYGANITYQSANKIAIDNKKKFKYFRSVIAEKEGITFEKFMKTAWMHYLKSGKAEWFDKVANVTGFSDMLDDPQPKGIGASIKTENKDGTVTEVKIVSFEKPKE